jgi:hypothetical protein
MDKAQNKAPTLSTSTTNGSNLSDFLFNDGSDLKWDGPFEKLKSFVETTLSLKGIWSSPKANTEKFTTNSKKDNFSITITFHSATKTLQIQGKDRANLKKDLLELATPIGILGNQPTTSALVQYSVDTRLVVNDSIILLLTTRTACTDKVARNIAQLHESKNP